MHELKFCFAEFQQVKKKDLLTGEDTVFVKSLTKDDLNMINYCIRKDDKVEYEPPVFPVSFMMSQFHIIFVYPKNFTVLSSITHEVIYSRNFDKIEIRSA